MNYFKEYIFVYPNCISTCSVVVVHGGDNPRLFIWWTIGCIYTHIEVRIGCIGSHIPVSHLSVPFYSAGKVCTPSEIYIYIYIGHCMLEKFGSSSSYTYISGLYCGLGIYWVELSIIYLLFCSCLFTWKPVHLISSFVHLTCYL